MQSHRSLPEYRIRGLAIARLLTGWRVCKLAWLRGARGWGTSSYFGITPKIISRSVAGDQQAGGQCESLMHLNPVRICPRQEDVGQVDGQQGFLHCGIREPWALLELFLPSAATEYSVDNKEVLEAKNLMEGWLSLFGYLIEAEERKGARVPNPGLTNFATRACQLAFTTPLGNNNNSKRSHNDNEDKASYHSCYELVRASAPYHEGENMLIYQCNTVWIEALPSASCQELAWHCFLCQL